MFKTWAVNCIRHGLCEFHDFETYAEAKAWVTAHAKSISYYGIADPNDEEVEETKP